MGTHILNLALKLVKEELKCDALFLTGIVAEAFAFFLANMKKLLDSLLTVS